MHIISRKTLRAFWEQYPDSQTALTRWFKIFQKTEFTSFTDLRATFPSADLVSDLNEYSLSQLDLPEIGSQGVVSEVIHGKRELNIRQIRALAKRFNVAPAVFL